MTPQEIISELNDHGFSDTSTTRKLAAINAAIRNIASRRPWPWLERVTTLTFSGSSAVPANMPARSRAVRHLIDTTTGRRVRFSRTDDLEEKYGDSLTQSGDPFFYYFEAGVMKVWKVPSSTQTLRLRDLQIPPTVTDSDPESAILVPIDGHEAVVARSLYRLYLLEDDPELAAPFLSLYDRLMAEMEDVWMSTQLDEPEYVHIIDVDDYDYDW